MFVAPVDTRPGFRRRVVVRSEPSAVAAMLEDDIHCLAVILRHDGTRVTAIEPSFPRAPWSTCPGAIDKLVETFAGLPLAEVTARRDKKQNCTHLHDMAVLAAAHAHETGEFAYDILVTDPAGGIRSLELRRDGALLHAWTEQDGVFTAPPEISGKALFSLRDWIGTLPGSVQEAARLLQWSSMVAMGRIMPMEQQSDASAMPPNCFTFQPEQAARAERHGLRRDFSDGSEVPLDRLAGEVLASL